MIWILAQGITAPPGADAHWTHHLVWVLTALLALWVAYENTRARLNKKKAAAAWDRAAVEESKVNLMVETLEEIRETDPISVAKITKALAKKGENGHKETEQALRKHVERRTGRLKK